MKVRELVELLQHANQDADVILSAHGYEPDLEPCDISADGDSVKLLLSSFIDDVYDFDDMLGAI